MNDLPDKARKTEQEPEQTEKEQEEAKIRERIQVNWNIRDVFEIVFRINDAFIGRKGQPIPLSPREIADILELRKFFDQSIKYVYRRCLCNTVYCRNPEKDKPCVLDPEEMIKDNTLIFSCRWRGKKL